MVVRVFRGPYAPSRRLFSFGQLGARVAPLLLPSYCTDTADPTSAEDDVHLLMLLLCECTAPIGCVNSPHEVWDLRHSWISSGHLIHEVGIVQWSETSDIPRIDIKITSNNFARCPDSGYKPPDLERSLIVGAIYGVIHMRDSTSQPSVTSHLAMLMTC